MAVVNFDPCQIYNSEWKKIYPEYALRPISTKDKQAICSECKQPGNLKRCGGCYAAAYCCSDHQRNHWKKEHRLKCCPYQIVRGDAKTVGRYVVATR